MSRRRLARVRLSIPARVAVETLESRTLLSRAIEMDPWLLSYLNTPKLRNPAPGFQAEVSPSGAAAPAAPALNGSWDAVNFATNGSNNGGWYYIPPDPIGAAGPTQVVNVVNCTIEWYSKSGTLQHSGSLGNQADGTTISGSLFGALNPVDGLYDPKVIYDQYNNRFVVVALEQQDTANGAATNDSRVLIAVSDDSDPNGTWHVQAIHTKVSISGVDTWFDYPGLAVGSDAIYLTGNMFGFGATGTFRGSRLWIIDKAGLYAGGTSDVTMYDPSGLAGLSSQNFTLQPAHMFGAAPGTVGTFLVASGWVQGKNDYLSVIEVDDPLASPTFSNTFVSMGDVHRSGSVPAAPQLGTSIDIDSGDDRVYNAVWRNSNLYLGLNVNPPNPDPDAGQATAHWARLSATDSTISLADQGNVGGEDIATNASTYYPAISVDAAGNMAIGFAASSPTTYVGAYYTGRLATDAAGTVQSSSVLAAGTDYYVRTFTSGSNGRNRWGDYTGLALDPTDQTTFWIYNEYATTRGTTIIGEDGQWATRWGQFTLAGQSATPTTPDLDATHDTGSSNSDNLTRRNNSSGANVLVFTVGGTVAGATVEVFADGTLIGSAVATGTSTQVTTDGLFTLADGQHSITARQTETGKPASLVSAALSITVDSVAPYALPMLINDGNAQRSMINQISASFSEAVTIAVSGLDIVLRSGGAVPNTTINSATVDGVNYVLTFTGSAVIGGSLADGRYSLVRTAASITDAAGNPLSANYVENFMRLFGDSDGDGDVDNADLNQFAAAYDKPANYVWYLDYQYADAAGGTIDATDYQQFKARLTRTILR